MAYPEQSDPTTVPKVSPAQCLGSDGKKTRRDVLQSLFRWANNLRNEQPHGLGENLLWYADAWELERNTLLDALARLIQEFALLTGDGESSGPRLSSGKVAATAEAMRILARFDRFEILEDEGTQVAGRFVDP